MISPTDLLRAAAQSARAAATVEIARNVAGSGETESTEQTPQADPQLVQTSLIADQILTAPAQAAGQTLAGLSDPVGGFQSLSFQLGQGGLQTNIAVLARQLASQFLQSENVVPGGQPNLPQGQPGGPVLSGLSLAPGQASGPSAQIVPSNIPGQPGGLPVQATSLSDSGFAALAEAIQTFLSPSVGAALTPRPAAVMGPSIEVAVRPEGDGQVPSSPRSSAPFPDQFAQRSIGGLRDLPDSQSATAAPSPRIQDGASSRQAAGLEPGTGSRDDVSIAAAKDAAAAAASLTGETVHDLAHPAPGLSASEDPRFAVNFLAQALSGHGGEAAAGGIIASFILNAAMIPGWTLPRLPPSIEEQFADLAKKMIETPEVAQADLLAYLANFGANEQLLERIRKAQLPPTISIKVLGFLAVLMTAITTILATLRQEATELLVDLPEQERNASDLEPDGKRKRLYLR